MRLLKLIIMVAILALIAVVGVGVSLAQTETPTPPAAPESTLSPDSTPEAGLPRGGFGMDGMMPGMPMRDAIMDLVTVALDEAAQQTGMTSDEIMAGVHGGQSLAEVIESENGDVQAVIDAVVQAATDKLGAAVIEGTLTQAQADRLTVSLEQLIADAINGKLPMMNGAMGRPGVDGFGPWNRPGRAPFDGPDRDGAGSWNPPGRGPFDGPGMGGFGRHGMHGNTMGMNAHGILMLAIANATDLEPGDIMRALRDGKTLADVITENGGSVDAVIASAVAAETSFINGHVELGQISREDADQRIAGLGDEFTQMLNMTMSWGRHHGGKPMPTPDATPEATASV